MPAQANGLEGTNNPELVAPDMVVRDAIELAGGEKRPQATWPTGFFDRIREDWGEEPFERPPQGELENWS
jgi:hypothetical protein